MPKKHSDNSEDITAILAQLANEDFCYMTTTGRVSGRPHEIEIWFGARRYDLFAFGRRRKIGLGEKHAHPAASDGANRETEFHWAGPLCCGCGRRCQRAQDAGV